MPRPLTLALGAALACAFSVPAMAGTKPSTRLVECGAESCLLVTGRRSDPASAVSINGYAVPVEGGRRWRAVVPVETVREWSDPYARTITVMVDDNVKEALLPIGLLGHAHNLAMLVVRVK
ncbi:MAG: hypothetical protein WCY92_02500 [Novosphingobium sp.]